MKMETLPFDMTVQLALFYVVVEVEVEVQTFGSQFVVMLVLLVIVSPVDLELLVDFFSSHTQVSRSMKLDLPLPQDSMNDNLRDLAFGHYLVLFHSMAHRCSFLRLAHSIWLLSLDQTLA